MENTTKLTYEEQTSLAGFYDNLASYFGGDPILGIEKYYGRTKTYLNVLEKMSNQLDKLQFQEVYYRPIIKFDKKQSFGNRFSVKKSNN